LKFRSLAPLATTLAIATPAAAQPAPAFKYATAEEQAEAAKHDKVKWEAAAQAGLLLTTGNSRVTTFSAGLSASRRDRRNKLTLDAGTAYAKSSIFLGVDADGNGTLSASEIDRPSSVTTQAWMLKGRYDRFLTAKNSLFAAAGMSADKPAGKELVGNGQLGYSRELYQSGPHTFVGEAGYDYAYEDLVAAKAASVSIHSLRGFVGYKGVLAEGTGLDGSVEGLFNVNSLTTTPGRTADAFEDDRVNGKLALTTKLSTRLAFRFSFEAKFDNFPAPRPPFAIPYDAGFTPIADKLDTKTEATLIVSLL